jgi:hypothetical protein
MASNKGKRALDKPTRDTLSDLDFALKQTITHPKQPGEFTIEDYRLAALERGVGVRTRTCLGRLSALVQAGVLEVRKIPCQGGIENVYRRANGASAEDP